ncbi:acyl-CoA dehydrogenase [Bacillus cereus]|uniref:acyl-CoA dehydrogenase family protein n=1 Tax=Bacillus cereus TaxID=1396 RepID=UPI000BFCEC42|nr:acyl-CoA dehydrogenase family protein [Bacillus cereus]PGR32547.1 acyl-CoA dehydrogenase [Bacillus cereus]
MNMKQYLEPSQYKMYQNFLDFVCENIEPYANSWEIEQGIPSDIIKTCAKNGYLGGTLPAEYGGLEWDYVTYGLFTEAIARGSVSLSGLFNVHTMVTETILKWGTENQKNHWLPLLASGNQIAALALTEPGAGSDLNMIKTNFDQHGDKLILNGVKKWITFGAAADVFLVFGKLNGEQPVACLVPKDSAGVNVTHIRDMLGFKAAYLAEIEFNNVEIPLENIIGRPGFAFTYLAPYALEFGRISIAFAALGVLRTCLEICGNHVLHRSAFGNSLIDHGMISHMVTDMGVDLEASILLSLEACKAKNEHRADATEKIMIAKYFASRSGTRHSTNAVQIMGALGCNDNYSISRCFRDSKTMEIVEGSNQIHQLLLGKGFAKKAKRAIEKIPVTKGVIQPG